MALGSGGNELRLDVAVNARDAILAANALAQQLQALAGSAQGAGAATAQMAQAADRQAGGLKAWARDWGMVAFGFNQFLAIGRQVGRTIYGISEAMDRQQSMMSVARADIGGLVSATRNLVGVNELLAASNRLMNAEFDVGQAAMEVYARAAWNLAERSGRSWTEAMEAIAAAAQGQMRGLRQFGIVVEQGADVLAIMRDVADSAEVSAGSLAERMDQLSNAAKMAAAGGLIALGGALEEVWGSMVGGQSIIDRMTDSLTHFGKLQSSNTITRLRAELEELNRVHPGTLDAFIRGAGGMTEERRQSLMEGLRQQIAVEEARLADLQARTAAERARAWLEIGPQGRARTEPRGGGARVARGRRGAGAGGGVPFGRQTEEEFLTGLSAGLAPESALESLMRQAVAPNVYDTLAASAMGFADAQALSLEQLREMGAGLDGVTERGRAMGEMFNDAAGYIEGAILAGIEGGEAFGKFILRALSGVMKSLGMRMFGQGAADYATAVAFAANPFLAWAAPGMFAAATKEMVVGGLLTAGGIGLGVGSAMIGGGGGGGGSSRSPGVGTGGGGGNEEPQRSVVINIMPGAVVTGDAGDVGEALYNLLGEGVRRRRVQTTEAGGRAVLAFR